MKQLKITFSIFLVCCLMMSIFSLKTLAQETNVIDRKTEKKSRGFFLFRKKEGVKLSPEAELKEKQKKEKEELIKKLQTEKEKEETLKEKTSQEELKNKAQAQEQIYKRNKEIKQARKKDRNVEVTTSENDPLYIQRADVLNTKTKFLKIKNVDLKYKLVLHNQTPKIINTALIIWERRIPFTESQTILKEVKISKPVIPYEKRVVEYNDLNSRREGETYKVKIAKVIFEDGTQWSNPL